MKNNDFVTGERDITCYECWHRFRGRPTFKKLGIHGVECPGCGKWIQVPFNLPTYVVVGVLIIILLSTVVSTTYYMDGRVRSVNFDFGRGFFAVVLFLLVLEDWYIRYRLLGAPDSIPELPEKPEKPESLDEPAEPGEVKENPDDAGGGGKESLGEITEKPDCE